MKPVLLRLIRFYQRYISPRKRSCCCFTPTCSHYAYTAVERYGAVRGGWLAFKRVVRCNPLSKGGYDPVPQGPSAIIRRDENP
ncbi:MAG: membrane protein insertion efficiency factor YidD [Clostridia bacterium]|nr:membrane protein insertion efficiency factor YidD [Clostridia bacterium]